MEILFIIIIMQLELHIRFGKTAECEIGDVRALARVRTSGMHGNTTAGRRDCA